MSDAHEAGFKIPIRSPKLNKVALKKIHSSPQLKNILRQKWQQRLKEKRTSSFNLRRFQPGEVKELIDESTSNEMYDLLDNILSIQSEYELNSDSDAAWEDWMQKICAEEEEQTVMSEYDDFLIFEELVDSFINNFDSIPNEVICPICQKNILTEKCGEIGCTNCKFVMPAKMSLEDFSNSINSKSTMHSENCNGCPTFITIPENNTIFLYLTCDICSCCLLIM